MMKSLIQVNFSSVLYINGSLKDIALIPIGSQISEVRMIRGCIKDFLTITESERAKLDDTLKGKRAESNISQVTGAILTHMKATTEQMQQHIEIYENISSTSIQFSKLYNMIKSMTKIDISTQTIQFRTEWKAYNLLLPTHLLLMQNDYTTAKEVAKYVIFWLQQNIGAKARSTSIHGFASHILAIIHRILRSHETSVQYYDSALEAYKGDCEWSDLQIKETLIDIVIIKQEQAKRKINFTGVR